MSQARSSEDREVRAGRNQALFRTVNEKLEALNEAFDAVTDTFVVACECADTTCVEMLSLSHAEYKAVRSSPRHFIVLPGHLYPEVERVVAEVDGYVVVEKRGAAAAVVEELAEEAE